MSTKLQHKSLSGNFIGISYMLLNAMVLSILYVLAKEITKEINSSMVVFLYKFIIILLIIPWCFHGGIKSMLTKRLGLHLVRGFMSASGSLCLFYAIKYIPLADINAIGYLEQVMWAIIGISIFGEMLTLSKVISIFMAFFGAVLVIYPGLIDIENYSSFSFINLNVYYIFVFLSIAFWVVNCTVVKLLGKTESSKIQLFYSLIFQIVITAPFALLMWQEAHFMGIPIKHPIGLVDFNNIGITFDHFLILTALAICYLIHSIAFFLSLKNAEFSVVVPFDYFRILFVAILGYLFFAEIPAKESFIGYSLIAISGIYLIWVETRYKRRLRKIEIKQLEEELEHA